MSCSRPSATALTFSATDLDMEIIDEALAQVDQPGQITAPAHTLYEIVRKLPEGADVSLSFTGEDPRLTVSAGRSRFNLPVLPAGDFPVMSSDGLAGAHQRRRHRPDPADRQDPLRHLGGGDALLPERPLRPHGGRGRRAASCAPWPPTAAAWPWPRWSRRRAPPATPGVIVPRKTINEARRLLDDAGETVELQISPQKVRFEFGGAALTSKVIDGNFPDYARVIPKDNNRIVMVDAKLFAQAVDRVATISAEKSRSVRMAIDPASAS